MYNQSQLTKTFHAEVPGVTFRHESRSDRNCRFPHARSVYLRSYKISGLSAFHGR